MSMLESEEIAKHGTLMIDRTELDECVDMAKVIDAVEDAFVGYEQGTAVMPPKTYVDLPKRNGDFRAMPAYVSGAAGIKWVNVHPDNPERYGLPTVMGVVIYSDPETAYPLAIMDGTKLTRYRTGAAAGVATRHLAPSDATSLGLLGAGEQAHTQLAAIAAEVDLERVVVTDLDADAIERFCEDEADRADEVVGGTPEDVAGCDVISTTTPSREPILKREWIDAGTHINAMGADAEGKRELDPTIIEDAAVVVDDWEQCSHSGEINVAVAEGQLSRRDVYGNLGEIITDALSAPVDGITVFDSTGLAIQDIATARLIYETAQERGAGYTFDLVGT
ncbi:ornithine cyclodeaminase family protein [Halomarina halobia]|uniref:Alanine dehydrogenase n=1 Tax=Halomarina halobia TaxID=3033386 RepID=A0ABD6AFL4_9EURY|nr:ornithine cyclodeaminase family protein [Halomarina sp. PSR21]